MMSSIKEAEYNTGFMQGKLEGWEEGFGAAKKAYYISPREDAEIRRLETESLNNYTPDITPEILMAYGVDSTSKLPKEIRDAFGIKDYDFGVDLTHLIEEDNNGGI